MSITNEERKHIESVLYTLVVGSLMYAIVCTRPDIVHAVGVVSRYMENLDKRHWEALKWVLRYLRGTQKVALYFKGASLVL